MRCSGRPAGAEQNATPPGKFHQAQSTCGYKYSVLPIPAPMTSLEETVSACGCWLLGKGMAKHFVGSPNRKMRRAGQMVKVGGLRAAVQVLRGCRMSWPKHTKQGQPNLASSHRDSHGRYSLAQLLHNLTSQPLKRCLDASYCRFTCRAFTALKTAAEQFPQHAL